MVHQLFNSRSPEAFKAVFDEFYARVVYLTDQYVEDMDIAREMSLDVFTHLFKHPLKYATLGDIRTALYDRVREVGMNYRKHTSRKLGDKWGYCNWRQDLLEIDVEVIAMLAKDKQKEPVRHYFAMSVG